MGNEEPIRLDVDLSTVDEAIRYAEALTRAADLEDQHFCDLPLTAHVVNLPPSDGVSPARGKRLPWQCDVCGNVWKWHARHVGKHLIIGWDLRWDGFVDWHTRALLARAEEKDVTDLTNLWAREARKEDGGRARG